MQPKQKNYGNITYRMDSILYCDILPNGRNSNDAIIVDFCLFSPCKVEKSASRKNMNKFPISYFGREIFFKFCIDFYILFYMIELVNKILNKYRRKKMKTKILVESEESFLISPTDLKERYSVGVQVDNIENAKSNFLAIKQSGLFPVLGRANIYKAQKVTKITFPDGKEMERIDIIEMGTDAKLTYIDEFFEKYDLGRFQSEKRRESFRKESEPFRGFILVGEGYQVLGPWGYRTEHDSRSLDGINFIYDHETEKWLTAKEAIEKELKKQ